VSECRSGILLQLKQDVSFSCPEPPFYKLTFLATSPPTATLSDLMHSLQLHFSRASGARFVCDVTLVDNNWPSPKRIYLWQL